jgi:large subunit ribosomal protein L30
MADQSNSKEKRVRITLVKSAIGYTVRQKRTVRALGLHRMHETVEHFDSPAVRGMINKVIHLLEVEEVE